MADYLNDGQPKKVKFAEDQPGCFDGATQPTCVHLAEQVEGMDVLT